MGCQSSKLPAGAIADRRPSDEEIAAVGDRPTVSEEHAMFSQLAGDDFPGRPPRLPLNARLGTPEQLSPEPSTVAAWHQASPPSNPLSDLLACQRPGANSPLECGAAARDESITVLFARTTPSVCGSSAATQSLGDGSAGASSRLPACLVHHPTKLPAFRRVTFDDSCDYAASRSGSGARSGSTGLRASRGTERARDILRRQPPGLVALAVAVAAQPTAGQLAQNQAVREKFKSNLLQLGKKF
jgi:hypothetical protein